MNIQITPPTVALPLLLEHLAHVRSISPPESTHALDLDALSSPSITFFTAFDGQTPIGCGALKRLGPDTDPHHDPNHGEIKSMRTAATHLRRGVASAILTTIISHARAHNYTRLSLETGSQPAFAPARALYTRFGFQPCGPFADYKPDPNSVFMTLGLC